MRIVLTNKSVNLAGGENYILYLAAGLRERNHDVIIAPLKNSELAIKSNELGYETIEMEYSAKGIDEIPLIFDFAKKFREKKIDIIHTNSNTDRTIGAFASRLLICKNVAQIHSHFSIKQRSHHSFRNKCIDHFITDSISSRNQLVYSDKVDENRVTAIHIGIPQDKTTNCEKARNEIRDEFGIGENDILIGSIGRLVPFKGHIYLLQAFKNLCAVNNNIKLMIVGDGEIEKELLTSCKEMEIANKVIFTGYRSDVDSILSSLDIYAHPSIDNGGESFPIAVLLALRSSLPIVATKVSDIPYQVKDKYNGYIVDAENAEALGEKISELIANPDLRKMFAANSFSHFKQNYTLDTMVDKIESIYKQILNKNLHPAVKKKPNTVIDFIKQFFEKQREVF